MISIIIPLYNVEQYVAECIESVANQTFKDVEIVLVDDFCTDRTVEVVTEYLATQNNVKYKIIKHTKNLGLSAARNTGLDNAKGDYVYFLDSDDILEPTALENLYIAIMSGDYAIAISYFTKYVDGQKSIYRKDWLFDKTRTIGPDEFAYRMLTEKSNFASTAKLYKKEVVQDVRFRLGKRNEDTLFIVDLIPIVECKKYCCIEIPDYSYYYRMRPGSISNDTRKPLGVDVLKNYDEAISVCTGKTTTIEWLRQRQFSIAIELACTMLCDRKYEYSLYTDICNCLSKFDNQYIKTSRSKIEYKMFIKYKYFPNAYRLYYRLSGRIKYCMFHKIILKSQTKIYNACLSLHAEREARNLDAILSHMTFHGSRLNVGKEYLINGAQYMEFGDSCSFGQGSWVECIDNYLFQTFEPKLIIGDNFSMQRNCHIGCIDGITIGNNVLLGSKVYITDHYHGEISKESLSIPPIDRPLWSKPVKIGNNVWIGDGVCIMPGVELGDNIIVGANSVVTHSFPENTVIAGCPARIIRVLV